VPEPPPAASLPDLFDLEDEAEDFLQDEQYEDALSSADAALAIEPKSLPALLTRGAALKALGRFWDASEALEKALSLTPSLATVHVDVANIYADLERLSEAQDHLVRAIEIEPSLVQAHANLGSVFIRMGRFDLAEGPTRYAISLDADSIVANQNLAAILSNAGDPQAKIYRDTAFRQQPFLVEKASIASAPTVLILSNAGPGNVPHQHILPRAKYNRIFWFLEYLPPGAEEEIPPYDLVFNAVGDPDAAPEALALACQFAQACSHPIMNLPDRVVRTIRSALPDLLTGVANALVPGSRRFAGDGAAIPQAIADSGLRFPLIVRPAGRHGGEGATKIDSVEDLPSQLLDGGAIYATEFVDYRSADGWYRKYRVIFIDRKLYPYHLAIGRNWLLHYWTAEMDADVARKDEELRFLQEPRASVGEDAWAALEAIAVALDLDYAGIDFSVLPDGRLLFFEANATMLVHPEDDQAFGYKNRAVRIILDAFDAMVARKKPR
jgi:tetratricopeptide (TPR) repeat protein